MTGEFEFEIQFGIEFGLNLNEIERFLKYFFKKILDSSVRGVSFSQILIGEGAFFIRLRFIKV